MRQEQNLGVNPLIFERSFGKLVESLMTGKGGLVSALWWLDQIDFVDGLSRLTNEISLNYTFVDTALTKCAKEALSRPEFIREEEIAVFLGYKCEHCGKRQSAMVHRAQKICSCGHKFKLTYLLVHKALRELNIIPTPEAVMMWVAYEGLADAYVQGYNALKQVSTELVKLFHFDTPQQFFTLESKDHHDAIFYYYEPGDLRFSKEERELLMLLARGVLADKEVTLKEVEDTIRAGIAVCKFGYLFNKLNCSGSDYQYLILRSKYSLLYNAINTKIRQALEVTREERSKDIVIDVAKLEEEIFYACALVPKNDWAMGKLSKNLTLKPLEKGKLPIYTDEENVAMNCYIAPTGRGKTTLMASVVATAVDWGHEYVVNVLSDEKNGLTLSGLPLFPCEGHTGKLLKLLASIGVQPKPLPCLNLVFLRPGEEKRYLPKSKYGAHPPTVFDRIVEIDNCHSFGLEFLTSKKATVESKGVVGNRGVLNILEEFALNLGYNSVCGIINVRNLHREEYDDFYKKTTRPDIQIGYGVFNKFMIFRQNNKTPSARILIDELSRFAPIMHNIAGTDTSMASALFNESVKAMRGANLSIDTATQSWNEVHPEAKKEALNIFFRDLSKSSDKAHSQRDLVLGSLDLTNGEGERSVISHIMETNKFDPKLHFWFWWNKIRGSIEVVRPNPPPFMINQPKKTNLQVFKAYEDFSGKKVLLDSWDDVPRLRYENDEYYRVDERPS